MCICNRCAIGVHVFEKNSTLKLSVIGKIERALASVICRLADNLGAPFLAKSQNSTPSEPITYQ